MKTLHTIYNNFAKRNLSSLRLLLVMLLTLTASTAWAETYSWTCSGTTVFNTSGSSLNGVNWKASIEGSSAGTGVSGEKCVQIAKNNGLTLETTGFNNKNITSISIQTWGSQENTFYLKDGDTQLATTQIPKSYSSNGAKISFSDVGVIKTKLVFFWDTATKAFNVRSITITYEDAAPSCSVKPTVGTTLQSVTATENSIKATIPISSIGGCNITENGLVYSTTNSTPTVGGSGCTTVTTTACGSTAANKTVTITGLTCGQSYYIRGYATNEAGTSYTDVTTQSTSDCPKYTVTLKDDNSTLTQSSAGESVTLPPRNGCDGYEFVGWTKSWSVAQTTWTTTAPTIIPAGSYTPTGDENLYPVYTKTEGGGTSYQFQQVTALSQIKAGGTFIITNGSYYLPNTQASSSGPLKADMVEVTNGVVTGAVTDAMKWTFSEAADDGKITIKSAANSTHYLYTTSSNNGLRVNNTSDTWTFEEYTVSDILGFAMKSTSNSRYCAVYTGGSDWRSYTTKNAGNYETNSGRLDLYKYTEISSTTTYYISVPDCCTQLAEVTNLKFSSITSNSITVAVPDDYSDKANASGYTFNCYSAFTGGSLVATANENGTSHTFTGLTKNTTYYFTVIAKGEGDYCNSVEASARESSKTLTQYTITLNPKGGTGDFSGWSNYTMTVDAGTEITLPELSKTGYDFAGWHDGGTTVASSYTPTKDITLTAQWTAIEYNITYQETKGATNSNPDTYTIEDEITFAALTNLPKGYNFTGWNPASIAKNTTGNQTVTAQWTEKALTRYRTDCGACIPLDGDAEIHGTYHFFPGETITLTVTPPADDVPYTYQWQKKVNSDYENIEGETGLTYTKENATTSDVGHYRCVVSLEGYCDLTQKFDVKCLQLYVYYDNKSDVFNTPLNRGAEENTATISVDLQNANYKYYFKITDGCGNWYGNTGTMESNNCTNWSMDVNEYCGLQTTKFGTYVFNVNYSDLAHLTVSVIYPAALQETGKEIYLDNNVLNWTHSNNADGTNKIYYRIGRGNHNNKTAMTLVPGTANLYKVTTSKYDNFEVWHIANNGCWSENHSIFKTKTGDEWAATQATAFETLPVTLAAVTVTPTTLRSVGGDENNNNCEFYNYDITEGMKTWNAEVIEPTNGTITVKYTHHDGTVVNKFTSGNRDLAHTCLLTITATANEGYSLTSLTVNDVPFTSGNVHTLTADAVIKAEFSINTHTVTWKPAGGNWSGDANDKVVEYEYGEEILAPEKPTYDCHEFAEWEPTYTAGMTMPDEDLEFTATWNKLSYNITFQNWDGSELQSSTVECGETPSYTGATPTREQTAQYTYTFKGWSPTIAPATQDQVYTAQFNQTTRSYTVIWYDGTGNAHKTQTANYNATVALPTTNPDPCDDEYPYFIGWTADPIVGSTTTQPELVENVTVTGDCDYYAVFAKGEAGENGSYTLDYEVEGLKDSNKWGSYGTSYSHTANDGSTWVIKAYKNLGMQINTGKNASIKIPTCPSPITSIEVTGTASKAVGLSASDYTGSETITYIASGTDATNQTLDLSGESVTGGYIVAKSGSISITKVIVNFGAQTEYTSFITTCCTSWTAPTLTYPTELEENGTATPQLGAGTTHGMVTYASSNPSILSVNSTTGEISAQAPGTATVTATWSGDETYCSVSSTSNVITVKGSFSVIYNANGGTGTMANQKADENNNIAQLNANQFTRTGYAFVGWNTSSSGTGTAYIDQQTNITLAQNLTLYAQWAPVVTLNDAGNEETAHPTAVGGTVTLPNEGANACSPYEFVGWTSVAIADWNGEIEEPELVTSPYKPTQPTTLYAVYKIQDEGNPNAFKLSYDLSGTPWYVGTYGSSPYIKAYSTITADDAVTFYKEKIENNTEKYWVYFERYDSYYEETTKEYLYVYNNDEINTTNNPSETQGWIITKLADGTYEFQSIGYSTKYLSFSDSGNSTDHTVGTRKTFNLLPAVSSTYYAIPDCDVEIKITFETGNGDFIANTPATNPLVVTPGETITLPTCDYSGDGIEFIGWLKNTPQEELSDIIAEVYYEGGEEYVVNDTRDVIFYAYYKVTPEEVEFTGQDDAELKIYHYNGVDNYYYANTFVGEHAELAGIERCFDATTWKFTNVGNMQYYIQDETGKYLGAVSDSDNDFSLSNTPKIWNFTLIDGLWRMICEDSPSRALMYMSTGKCFRNAALSNISNSAYSYVTLGICPDDGYTTNPVLSQGFSITNTAMVTSASGQKVKATSALTLETRNIELPCTFTIAAPNITFYDNTGAEITQLTASAASEQFELHFAYKPTAENTMEYPTITITDDEHKTYTIKNRIYARSLPADFVIAAKVGNLWYALPSQGLNSTDALVGYPVEVDNQDDPTVVTSVPDNADWSLRQVYASSGSNDRFKLNGANIMFENNASPAKMLNASVSDNYLLTNAEYDNYKQSDNQGLYEWTPTTTDLETYTLTNAGRTDKKLNVSVNTVFGVHAQNVATNNLRFLPIDDRYTPLALQVVEWKENSIVVMYNGDPAQTASVSVNGGAAQTTTLSAAQRDIAVYELTATGLAANPTQRLSIIIGAEKLLLPIPYIVNSNTTDAALTGNNKTLAAVSDLVVLNGKTFTADAATASKYIFRNVTIYGGGKLVIPADKGIGVNTLTMRLGTVNDDGSYTNSYPQLVLNGTINTGNINVDYLTTYDRYYALSLPYKVNTTSILYPADIYGDNLKDGGNQASFALQYYDGKARATGATGWKDFDESGDDPTLSPYKGYTFWGAPRKVKVNGATEGTRQKYGIHRIPITETASDLMKGEKSLDDNGNVVTRTIDIKAYPADRPNDMGWNFLGNPYLAQYGGLSADNESVQVGLLEQEMIDGKWTGGWKHTGNLRYITTTTDGQTYTPVEVDKATFSPFNTFFIQAAKDGALQFASASRAQQAPVRQLIAEQQVAKEITTGIILTGNDQTDRTGLLIADNFTEEYDFNADLSKFENSGINLYTIGKDGKLAFMAINQALAEQPIPLGYGAPADGEYTIAFDEDRYNATDISALYLIDYDRNETTNLLHTDYSFVTTAGTNNERFALQVAFIPQNATSVEWVDDATIQVAVDGNNLLLNNLPTDAGVQVFDALGRVIYATPNAPTEMQITLPTGYYLVRIADKQHAVVINTVIP